ncbi:hypothetical protein [Streptomyces sp. NBC_01304]|uniref:hypothetical protein n=1 Tax=Streptomyces sp. NBC_01304 TaxID=2903818 RepID=UPI002E10AA38|nr:hypothetical protein OG430_44595 [Streptomyces sp. NBC_01304]
MSPKEMRDQLAHLGHSTYATAWPDSWLLHHHKGVFILELRHHPDRWTLYDMRLGRSYAQPVTGPDDVIKQVSA